MMNIDIQVLDILFREISPEEVLENLRGESDFSPCSPESPGRIWFRRFARGVLSGYSEDELDLIYEDLVNSTQRRQIDAPPGSPWTDRQLSFAELALFSVKNLSDKLLRQYVQEPRCKIHEVLRWREAFLRMGQDLFVCAFLAGEDMKFRYSRQEFAWPAVIRTDHVPLNALLERGLAENHQHLYGSSQTFSLAWMDLMNFPEDHEKIGKYIPLLRKKIQLDRDSAVRLTLPEKVRLASFLRIVLFNDLCGHWNRQKTMETLQGGLTAFPLLPTLNGDISLARSSWGAQVPQPDGSTAILDYALTREVFSKSADEPYRALGGERFFLHRCFQAFYGGKLDETLQWAFYLYLLLKLQFRNELIQVNAEVGFENFSIYQRRKTTFAGRLFAYEAELIRMALVAPRAKENVTSLETRVSPLPTSKKDRAVIMEQIEPLRDFAQKRANGAAIPTGGDVFYVFHFTKSKDWNLEKGSLLLEPCRHAVKRKDVRRQALALAGALSSYADLREMVRGIDSASNEIGCPPEVFANAFRFLRNFRVSDFRRGADSACASPVRLSATYHVGEDFLDIASALRAIDETVEFLELERGDRIGHALGLGVLPEIHYARKSHRVFLRKQDRLDDIVWLLYRGQELGAVIEPDVSSRLRREAEKLLMEIYRPIFESERWSVTLTDYHCIMQLRGDAPSCYKTGSFVPPTLGSPYESFAVSYRDDARNAYRSNRIFSNFYYQYHFNHDVKVAGNEVCSVEIDRAYMRLIRQVQEKMQGYLQDKGIIVECNPSSNVLIGTFRDYHQHPVFRLHQTGLSRNDSPKGDMQVCINTDDLGVFDTSLEFEYALLFQSLREQQNADGSHVLQEDEILDYLERLRCMGHWAVFPKIQS